MIDRRTKQPFCQTRVVRQCKKTADPQMAHLVLPHPHNPTRKAKPTEPFFENAPTIIVI